MNRLLPCLFLSLWLAGCGATNTPAGATDATSDGSDDSGADAGADAVAVTPTAACKSDCDTQKQDCATLDLAQCYGLCDYVVPGLATADCVAKQTAVWTCEAVTLFVCATDTNVVGALKDPNACHAEHVARDAACPK